MKKRHVEKIRHFSQKTDEVSYGIFSAHNCRRLCEINTISMHACSACGPIGYPQCQRTVLAVAWPFLCYFYNLFHLFRYSSGARFNCQQVFYNSADFSRAAWESKFGLFVFVVWCCGVPQMKGATEVWKNVISFKVLGCVGWVGGLCMAMSTWGVQSGSPYGQFLGFLLFQICINGPLKEAQLLKTADNKKGGGERQASSK